jgi:hypothetical protein
MPSTASAQDNKSDTSDAIAQEKKADDTNLGEYQFPADTARNTQSNVLTKSDDSAGRSIPEADLRSPSPWDLANEGTRETATSNEREQEQSRLSDNSPPVEGTFAQERTNSGPTNSAQTATVYTAKTTDTFGALAKASYGTSAYAKALFAYRRDKMGNNGLLRAGERIPIPAVDVLQELYPNLCPRPRPR